MHNEPRGTQFGRTMPAYSLHVGVKRLRPVIVLFKLLEHLEGAWPVQTEHVAPTKLVPAQADAR